MDLFASAGIDLPHSGGRARGRAAAPRLLRPPLFAHKVVEDAILRSAFAPDDAIIKAAGDYARKVRGLKAAGKLNDWHELDFGAFRAEVKRAFHAEIPLRERGEWEAYLRDNAARVHALTGAIAGAEREIDQIVYGLFDLTPDEIVLLEASLEGQY
jgi:hypothetical protein